MLLYASEPGFPEHARCRELLEAWRRQPTPWYTSWNVVHEFLRVATHPRVFRRPWSAAGAWSSVEALLAAPGLRLLTPTDRHTEIASASSTRATPTSTASSSSRSAIR